MSFWTKLRERTVKTLCRQCRAAPTQSGLSGFCSKECSDAWDVHNALSPNPWVSMAEGMRRMGITAKEGGKAMFTAAQATSRSVAEFNQAMDRIRPVIDGKPVPPEWKEDE